MTRVFKEEAKKIEGGFKIGELNFILSAAKFIYQLGVSLGETMERVFFQVC